jgi:spore germination protein GerM
MSRLRLRYGLVRAVIVAAALASCGVPQDDSVRVIADVPKGLTATTTSTTTTTLAPTTTSPPSTVPQTSTTTPVTSQAPPSTIPTAFALYFVMGDRLIRVIRRADEPTDAEALTSLLVLGPFPEDNVPFARTAIEFGDIERITVAGGIATVDLGSKFADLPSSERRRAVAQLVLTLAGRPGIGPVRFRLNGQPIAVPRGDGSIAGRTVSSDDYVSLVDDPNAATTTIPTSNIAAIPAMTAETTELAPTPKRP